MHESSILRGGLRRRWLAGVAVGVFAANSIAPAFADNSDASTASPIKHVIVIIGENRSFDHIFATYKPVRHDEQVLNLLSEGIVREDGTPGPNYLKATQAAGFDTDSYHISPSKQAYAVLPPALTGGPATPYVCSALNKNFTGVSCDDAAGSGGYFDALKKANIENGLEDEYLHKLLTGGTGQASKVPDARVKYDGQDASHLPPGPYQLTNANYPYDAYAASPVHRFMQMQQQLDCDASKAKKGESSGCSSDLYPWVEVTVGAGSNGAGLPAGFNNTSTGEGSTSMGFFNVLRGDAPYLKALADTYAMSDNYHQAVKGGTGANHIMIGTADAIYFENAGKPVTPPHNTVNPASPGLVAAGASSALSEIENPNPQPGTNNFYTQDGYGGGAYYGSPANVSPNANYGGGSYVNCADEKQPGVSEQAEYMEKLHVERNCQDHAYYLVNNYNPGYFSDGTNAFVDTNADNTVFTIPPSSVKTIGDVLNEHKISWAYFGDQFDVNLKDKYDVAAGDEYCNICNWAQYSTSLMTSADRSNYLKDTADLYAGIQSGSLPSVSYVKPSGLVDGHPASSKLNLFEGFVKKIVDAVNGNDKLRDTTAIFITFDEGGGYWDSGYVQPLDFFGDGTRIPMLVVSRFSRGGHISHSYTDHVSIAKFIERNWRLSPITHRSRDNLPNPQVEGNAYVPVNTPALGDLWDLFDFDH